MGAEIIKIEKVGDGDLFRSFTFFNKWIGGSESPCFLAFNRNKRSIALNLKSDRVKEVIYKMVEEADVVAQNFRPGVFDRLGYGYDDFKAINPGIIYCSGSGYGINWLRMVQISRNLSWFEIRYRSIRHFQTVSRRIRQDNTTVFNR